MTGMTMSRSFAFEPRREGKGKNGKKRDFVARFLYKRSHHLPLSLDVGTPVCGGSLVEPLSR